MGCGRAETHVSDGPLKADWKRAADGIGMAGIAVFLLLNTTGVLPWSFWMEAIALWPLLIMSAGIKIAFERTRAPWLVLLGPALVLGGLAWVATGARTDIPVGPWKSEGPLPRPEGAKRVNLDLKLFGSRLAVTARELEQGALADARSIERHSSASRSVMREDDVARVRLDATERHGVVVLPGRRQRWELGVPTELPLSYELGGAMVRSRFDLSRSRFEGGRVNGVFLATQLTLPAVEAPVKLTVNGVFNMLRVSVPEGTPVRVRGTGFPFNAVKRRVVGEEGRPGYEIQVDGIFNAVVIETRQAAPADAPPPPPEAPPGPAQERHPKPEAEPAPPAPAPPVRG
jgi:hypothetical protein